jgi:D-sedoheptulose 7-phosphate isomerase
VIKIESAEKYLNQLKKSLSDLDLKEINTIVDILLKAYKDNKQIFIMGNGGSAVLASHFACDLGKGTLKNVYDDKEKRFRVISLTDNVALMTAFSNDLNYEYVFSQQLNNLVNEGDVVIGVSASGNSKNIIHAISLAKKSKAITIGFLGFDGGKLKELVDFKIVINNNHYGIIEDAHSALQHMICDTIRKRLP